MTNINVRQTNTTSNQNKGNVVGFKGTDTVGERVDIFLRTIGRNSKNTYDSYKGHISEYFMYTLGKEVDNVTLDELYGLTINDTDRYVLYLDETRKQAPSTINTKIASLSRMFQFLHVRDKQIDRDIMSVERMTPTTKNVSYGALTEEEFYDLLEFCSNDKVKGETKRIFFEIAIQTGFRKNAILDNFTWGCLAKEIDRASGVELNVIKEVEDKGGKNDTVPISDEFYDRLMEFKESDEVDANGNDDRVVSLNPKTVESVMRRWKKADGIEDNRNIAIHSIKSTGCDMVWNRTKDIKAVSDYAHHSDINTTYKHYLGKNESLMDKASYFAFEDREMDLSGLEDMSKEDIIELIKGSSISTISEIVGKIEV